MRDLAMQMTGSSGVLSVPDEHLPGLIALVLIGPVVWMALAGLRALAARRVGWAAHASIDLRWVKWTWRRAELTAKGYRRIRGDPTEPWVSSSLRC